MKVVSFIEDRRVVEKILRHLDLLAGDRPPCLRTDSPTPKSPKGVRASVKSPRKLLTAFQDSSNLALSWSRVVLPFHRETSRRSRPGPEDQIPIPIP